jgi:hypothetical protein
MIKIIKTMDSYEMILTEVAFSTEKLGLDRSFSPDEEVPS